MKIRILLLFLVLSLLFCSCTGSTDNIDTAELASAVEKTNSETKISGQYMLEMSFGEGVTLYYALGDVAWDTEKEIASASFNQTYLGVSSKAENYFANGKIVSVEMGESVSVDRTADELFSKFPYCDVLGIGESGNITVAESTVGRTYTIVRDDTKQICETIVGQDIYGIANVIKKPQPEKTEYSQTTCVYTISEGELVSCRYEFDVKLFDTPAYVPGGYSVPESEYTLDVHVVAKMSYKAFGADVTVSEYSQKSS